MLLLSACQEGLCLRRGIAVAFESGNVSMSGLGESKEEMKGARDEARKPPGDLAVECSELERAHEELKSLGSSVAHDMRAPLHFVSMFASALREELGEELPEEAAQYVDMICEGVEQLDEMVGGLGTLLKLWGVLPERAEVAVETVVEAVVAELEESSDGKRCRFEVGELPVCSADEALLRRVFVSLLENAVKFSKEETEPVVRVTYRERDGEGVFCVADNGIGLDVEKAEVIFKPFKRLQEAEHFDGVGMGLALAERIVERHGGRIWAEGTPGTGARFCFSLGFAPQEG